MAIQFCSQRLEAIEKLFHSHGTFALALCVLHITFAIVAAFGNLLIILTLRKISSIPTVAKKLFLNMAFSDHAVGIFAQLMFGIIFATMSNMEANEFDILCSTRLITICYFAMFLLAGTSFLTVSTIAADRLLAIYLHLRYQELVTSRRVCKVLVSLWILSAGAACLYISLPNQNGGVVASLSLFGILVTSSSYIYIFKKVRYHRSYIHNQCRFSNTQARQALREKKSMFTGFKVYIVFLALRLPNLIVVILQLTVPLRMAFVVANQLTLLLTLLNSSLNPVIYCLQYREIRENTKKIIRKLFCDTNNGAS